MYFFFMIMLVATGGGTIFIGKLTLQTKLVENSPLGFFKSGKLMVRNERKAEQVGQLMVGFGLFQIFLGCCLGLLGATNLVYGAVNASVDLVSGKTAEDEARAQKNAERRANLKKRQDERTDGFDVSAFKENPRAFGERMRSEAIDRQKKVIEDIKRSQSEFPNSFSPPASASNEHGSSAFVDPQKFNAGLPESQKSNLSQPEFRKSYPFRTWILADGRKAKFALVEFENGEIVVVDEKGVQKTFLAEDISVEDQTYVLEATEE